MARGDLTVDSDCSVSWFALPVGSARRIVQVLQVALVAILVTGLVLRNVSVVINAAFSLAVTLLPALLTRDFGVHFDPWLVLWIALAALLHSLGMVGAYESVWWWDHLTHAFSAALVTAIGYAIVVAIDRHSDAVHLPPAFLWLIAFLLTVTVGVVWEIVELLGHEAARAIGAEPVLIVYGVEDTILDLVFNCVGAVVAAVVIHLGGGRALVARFGP
jgi:FlaA1/EpsC-like NDP-sugar epimerase